MPGIFDIGKKYTYIFIQYKMYYLENACISLSNNKNTFYENIQLNIKFIVYFISLPRLSSPMYFID